MTREASVERNTKETEIKLKLTLDGTGYSDIETGVGFFNHMLDGFTRHGLFDLCVQLCQRCVNIAFGLDKMNAAQRNAAGKTIGQVFAKTGWMRDRKADIFIKVKHINARPVHILLNQGFKHFKL